MTKTQPLTIPNLITALKKAGFTTTDNLKNFAIKDDLKAFATKDDLKAFATKDDIATLRKQIDDDQFEARTEFYAKMIKPDLKRLDEKIDKVNDSLSLQISGIKDDLSGLSSEFSTSPSRKEFKKLSRSVFPQ